MPNAEGRKVALITGVCGQDGSYLTELLLEKGYIVHGEFPCSSARAPWRDSALMAPLSFYQLYQCTL